MTTVQQATHDLPTIDGPRPAGVVDLAVELTTSRYGFSPPRAVRFLQRLAARRSVELVAICEAVVAAHAGRVADGRC